MQKLLISVGEASGDRQAAALLAALSGQVHVLGKVGPELQALGAERIVGLQGHFGLSRPVAMLRELRESRSALLAATEAHGVKRALLVDYSGFHIPLGRALRRRGVHVVGFIPPKLWAWGGWRLKKARQAYDELFTILPFEADWWAERGVKARYCGNPIADETPSVASDPAAPVALVPGSRAGELAHVGPLLAATARLMLQAEPTLRFRVPLAPTLLRADVERVFSGLPIDYVSSMVEAASGASAALVCNGTAGLEVALMGTPHLLTYRTGRAHWALGRSLVHLDVTAPGNLVLTRAGHEQAWDEIFQGEASAERLAAAAMTLRHDAARRAQQLTASETLRGLLAGGCGLGAVAKAWQG
jgi:lipid-A-disaccharide synthase